MSELLADECFFGSVTVGERGQIVIPSDVRKSLHIEPGDRLLVFRHPMGHGLMLTKLDSVQNVIALFQKALENVESGINVTETDEDTAK